MENLILPNNLTLVELQEEATERANKLSKVVVDPSNPRQCEDLRTDTNKWIKNYESALESFVNDYSKPAKDFVKPYEDALNPILLAVNDLSERILIAKKEAFKNKVHEKYNYLVETSDDGVIYDFEEIYEPSWYGKPEKMWFPLLIGKLKKLDRKSVSVERFIKVECDGDRYSKLILFLKENSIKYEEM